MSTDDPHRTVPRARSFPPPVRRSAAVLAWGALLLMLAVPVLLASAYTGLTRPPEDPQTDPSIWLAWLGWPALVTGAVLLSLGLLRYFDHADRNAGVVITAK